MAYSLGYERYGPQPTKLCLTLDVEGIEQAIDRLREIVGDTPGRRGPIRVEEAHALLPHFDELAHALTFASEEDMAKVVLILNKVLFGAPA